MSSYTRTLSGPEDGGMRIGCSECGGTYMWPEEIRRESDGMYRCLRFCAMATNKVDIERKRAMSAPRKGDAVTFNLPGAPAGGVED